MFATVDEITIICISSHLWWDTSAWISSLFSSCLFISVYIPSMSGGGHDAVLKSCSLLASYTEASERGK